MAKISLCMIVGNVEEYIERCLNSFAPIADEMCIVQAIGNQIADSTIPKARAVAAKHGIPINIRIYLNAPEHDWPHVDSFAAARQQSFDMATGDYCFWCDSDDVLESGADVARELANRGGYAAFIFPYKIFARGVVVPRERMMAKQAGQWLYPVHECFKFHIEPVQAVEDNRVIVTHMPHFSGPQAKSGSNERNLRILRSIPEEQMTAGIWYHLQGELAGAGDIPGSIEAAKKALACKDIGKPEKYELFLNLARTAEHPAMKEHLLHEAYRADPCRREALGLLTCNALDYGLNRTALAYARQMMATLKPKAIDWNERQAAYGWLGDDIYCQALRANGYGAEAEAVRKESLRLSGGPRIALIHATRGRCQQASMARKIWLDFAERPEQVEHLFIFDEDDKDSMPLARMHHLCISPGGGCVAAWNAGSKITEAPVLVQMSDDWMPPPMWDRLILERLGDISKPSVLAVRDGVRFDRLLCMAICTRAYLKLDGYFFHPKFTGVFSDNWFTELAYNRNAVIEARDLTFEHLHPTASEPPVFGKFRFTWDETYRKQNAPEQYVEGQRIFNELKAAL